MNRPFQAQAAVPSEAGAVVVAVAAVVVVVVVVVVDQLSRHPDRPVLVLVVLLPLPLLLVPLVPPVPVPGNDVEEVMDGGGAAVALGVRRRHTLSSELTFRLDVTSTVLTPANNLLRSTDIGFV